MSEFNRGLRPLKKYIPRAPSDDMQAGSPEGFADYHFPDTSAGDMQELNDTMLKMLADANAGIDVQKVYDHPETAAQLTDLQYAWRAILGKKCLVYSSSHVFGRGDAYGLPSPYGDAKHVLADTQYFCYIPSKTPIEILGKFGSKSLLYTPALHSEISYQAPLGIGAERINATMNLYTPLNDCQVIPIEFN